MSKLQGIPSTQRQIHPDLWPQLYDEYLSIIEHRHADWTNSYMHTSRYMPKAKYGKVFLLTLFRLDILIGTEERWNATAQENRRKFTSKHFNFSTVWNQNNHGNLCFLAVKNIGSNYTRFVSVSWLKLRLNL